jgi:hypothetical protein
MLLLPPRLERKEWSRSFAAGVAVRINPVPNFRQCQHRQVIVLEQSPCSPLCWVTDNLQ